MSRVYFHSPSDEAELRGSERAYASGIVQDIANGLLHLNYSSHVDRLIGMISPGHYMARMSRTDLGWANNYQIAFSTECDESNLNSLISWQGRALSPFKLTLNTACLVGNDQVRFLARLHGQCEIHGWVDGPNRAWLADLITVGRQIGLYRPDVGWESVIELLISRDDEPVVMSDSTTNQFPDPDVANWSPTVDETGEQIDDDEWYELSEKEQWRLAMTGLRSERGLEITPDGFASFRFGDGLTVLDLLAQDWIERLSTAQRKVQNV